MNAWNFGKHCKIFLISTNYRNQILLKKLVLNKAKSANGSAEKPNPVTIRSNKWQLLFM